MLKAITGTVSALIAVGTIGIAAPAAAQSSAASYSYGTYNPVQAAINRDSMNAAIIRQATGGKRTTGNAATRRTTPRASVGARSAAKRRG